MKTKLLLGVACVWISALALSDTFVLPHVLEKSGRVIGVASSSTGGHARVSRFDPLMLDLKGEACREVSQQLGAILDASSLDTDLPFPVEFGPLKVHQVSSNAGGGSGGQIELQKAQILGFSLPELSIWSKEEASLRLILGTDGYQVRPNLPLSSAAKEAVQRNKAKKWFSNNFRMVVSGRRSDGSQWEVFPVLVEPMSYKGTKKEEVERGQCNVVVGRSSLPPGLRIGEPLRFELTLLDERNDPIIQFEGEFTLETLAPRNIYGGDLDGDGYVRLGGGVKRWRVPKVING